ncbi:MAG: hypothetical protein ACK4Q5_16730 [Saprospiraceae bacterium]
MVEGKQIALGHHAFARDGDADAGDEFVAESRFGGQQAAEQTTEHGSEEIGNWELEIECSKIAATVWLVRQVFHRKGLAYFWLTFARIFFTND